MSVLLECFDFKIDYMLYSYVVKLHQKSGIVLNLFAPSLFPQLFVYIYNFHGHVPTVLFKWITGQDRVKDARIQSLLSRLLIEGSYMIDDTMSITFMQIRNIKGPKTVP